MTTTIELGDALELHVLRHVRSRIQANRFYFRPDVCSVLHKPKYYSHDRKADITFDVGIEVRLSKSSSPSIYVLIECKNYGHAVPVDDVEEFFQKVEQVKCANSKLIMFASSSYQRGAIEFARSKGIALVRVFPPSKFKWVLHRDIPVDSGPPAYACDRVLYGLRTDNYRSQRSEFYCCAGNHFSFSTESLAEHLANECKLQSNILENLRAADVTREQVNFVSLDEIEMMTTRLLKTIEYADGAVDLDRISKQLGVNVRVVSRRSEEQRAQGLLGEADFRTQEITIFPELNSGRRRFTLAHELGHFALGHGKYLSKESVDEADFSVQADTDRDSSDIRRLEWQANCFAGRLLMPSEALLVKLQRGPISLTYRIAATG